MRKKTLLPIAVLCSVLGLLVVPAAMGQQAPAPMAVSSAQPVDLQKLAIPQQGLKFMNWGDVAVLDSTSLKITAKGGTNIFVSPSGTNTVVNAPMVLFTPDRDFILRAKVSATFRNVYDVGTLLVFEDEKHWAKLCFENSVRKEPTVVSVVTREYSDDANSDTVGASSVYLAIVRKGEEWSFQFSRDGREWRMVRHFRMAISDAARVGFAAHDSRGDGFSATFSEIAYISHAPKSVRELELSDLL
jgi:regulation of enolase protein 1 (concanavalin A-like superfamily)